MAAARAVLDVLTLLNNQAAQNRANFAQAQADRAEAAATKPQQWMAQGRDADSGRMALSADGDEARLIGDRLTSGAIKRGQSVRVNGANGTVTVDQKPSKQRQSATAIVPATVQPYWVAFGTGFAVSFDAGATSFTEAQYPEYEEYAAAAQGSVMFPYGRISCFAAASLDLWVVGGRLEFDPFNHPEQHPTVRLPLAISADQGKTWQISEQRLPYVVGSNVASSLVWGNGSFWAIIADQVWHSEDGLEWERLQDVPPIGGTDGIQQSLAVWNETVYLMRGRVSYFLQKVEIFGLTDAGKFVLAKTLSFTEAAQYGAYFGTETAHLYASNYFNLAAGLYPQLLSSNDLDAISDYGSAVYLPAIETYLNLLHLGTNQQYPVAFAGNIDGQVFLMLSQRWGLNGQTPPKRYGFAAIHEGDSWRTCEHPFNGKIDVNYLTDSDVHSVAYSAALQQWLVYEARSYLSLSGINGDDWSEPVLPELVTALDRPVRDPRFGPLEAIASQVKAFQVAGNYVS